MWSCSPRSVPLGSRRTGLDQRAGQQCVDRRPAARPPGRCGRDLETGHGLAGPILVGWMPSHRSTVVCKLDRVEKGLAIVHAQGAVSGSAEGVSSEITVAAKFSFDTQRQANHLVRHVAQGETGLGTRPPRPGSDRPGADGDPETVQRADAAPETCWPISNLKPDEPARLLEFRSPAGGFEVLLDRRWHVMIEREDVSVLRMVDRGDLIAQATSPLCRRWKRERRSRSWISSRT